MYYKNMFYQYTDPVIRLGDCGSFIEMLVVYLPAKQQDIILRLATIYKKLRKSQGELDNDIECNCYEDLSKTQKELYKMELKRMHDSVKKIYSSIRGLGKIIALLPEEQDGLAYVLQLMADDLVKNAELVEKGLSAAQENLLTEGAGKSFPC